MELNDLFRHEDIEQFLADHTTARVTAAAEPGRRAGGKVRRTHTVATKPPTLRAVGRANRR